MENKKYFRFSELQASTIASYKNKEIFVKGEDCGFQVGDEYISYRKGYSTGIYSYKSEGKSQFVTQEMVHLSVKYGWKHALWLSESGKKSEIVIDIVMCYLGKSFYNDDVISDKELEDAISFLDTTFFIIDHEKSMLNIRDIYETVGQIELAEGIKIDGVCIDNATNLAREQSKNSLMIHEYMNYLVTAINRTSLNKNYHTFILYHVGKPDQMAECKVSKKKFRPCPSDFTIVGGQMTGFLSYQLFSVWRPCRTVEDYGIVNPNTGIPYEINETVVTVTKSKPKKIGCEGTFSLFFDKYKQQYYEISNGTKYYAGQLIKTITETKEIAPSKMKPSNLFG